MADNKVNSGLLEFSEDQKVFVALDAETSEVKKAVTIDGDGVETDMLGVQPTGKKEITSTAEVNVANYATAQVVDEDLVAGNIKKDVDILGVVGSYEGGGASDFSTATVSINNTSAHDAVIQIANIVTSIATFIGVQASATVNMEAVLYNGVNGFDVPEGFTVSAVTGAITHEDGYVEITGDGTVTLATA